MCVHGNRFIVGIPVAFLRPVVTVNRREIAFHGGAFDRVYHDGI